MAVAVALTAGFTACSNEEDDIFNQSAAERLNASSEKYSERLTAQPNGWAMQLYPTTEDSYPEGCGYLVLLDFNPDHMVRASMNNILTNNVYTTDSSYWEVITDDGPVLSFDTYNSVVHAFSDPYDLPFTGNRDTPINEQGTGMGGDYEFIIVDAPDDASYMMLKGKKRGTYNLLTPIEEGVDYQQYLTDVNDFMSKMFPANEPSTDYIHFADSVCVFSGASDGIPSIYPVGGDPVTTQAFNPFIITKRGDDYYLRFRDTRTFGDESIQDFRYDTGLDRFVSTVDTAYYIEGSNPLTFFANSVDSLNDSWSYRTSGGEASESFTAACETITRQFSSVNRRYSLRRIYLRKINNQVILRFEYGTNRNYADFNLSITRDNDGLTLNNQGPANTGTSNILSRVPGLQTIVDMLTSSKLTVSSGTTNFDLSTIRLTSTSNPNDWVVLTM